MRQAVREWAIAPGFSLVDQTKIVTAASELARNTVHLRRRRHGPARGAERRRPARPAARLRGPGPGHRRTSTQALQRRLHDRRRARARARRRAAARQRVRDRLAARRRDAGGDHAMEVTEHARPRDPRCRAAPVTRGATAARSRAAALGFSTRRRSAALAHRRDRGGDQPREARRRRRAAPAHARRATGRAGVGMLALDRGPGIRQPRRGAARRLLDRRDARHRVSARSGGSRPLFDIYSVARRRGGAPGHAAGRGTPPASAAGPIARGINVAYPGEHVSRRRLGASGRRPERAVVLMSDGLGHGRARGGRLAQPRVGIFRQRLTLGPAEIARAHARRAARRRAAPRSRSPRSTAGTASSTSPASATSRGPSWPTAAPGAWSRTTAPPGTTSGSIQEFRYPWPPAATLVLHSDGLISHWTLDRYPGLARRGIRCSIAGDAVPRLPPRPRRHVRGRAAGGGVMPSAPARWRFATSATSCSRASARGRSRRCSASTPRTRRASRPRSRRSRATPSRYARGGDGRVPARGHARRRRCSRSRSRTRARASPTWPRSSRDGTTRATGMGLGIVGARRLMDQFDDRVAPGRGHDGRAEAAAAAARRACSVADAIAR